MTEALKTLLIIVLTVTMILLTVCFFMVSVASDALYPDDLLYEFVLASGGEKNKSDTGKKELEAAAFPCQISFMTGAGQLYMPISHQEYSDALSSTQQFFEEAIGSAYNYHPVPEGEYILSLLQQGLLCVYDYPIPFYMLCYWAGSDYSGEAIDVSTLFIYSDESGVSLLIKDASGGYHSFLTRADSSFITRTCSDLSPNGVISATTSSHNTADDVPILSGGISLPCYTAGTSYSADEGERTRSVMSILSINPYLASVYKDGDTTIYIEDSSRLHLYADGHISYSVADQSGGIPIPLTTGEGSQQTVLSMLEGVRGIIFPLWEELSSNTVQLSLSSIEEKDGAYTIYFEAYIGGCYISRGDISAAAALIEDGKITNISLYPLSIRRQKDVSVLPYAQAQAASRNGAVLRVQYVLNDDMSLVPIIADVKEGE